MDDSIGEAFDKIARFLSLPWVQGRGGGPGAALEEAAASSKNPYKFQLPVPLTNCKTAKMMRFSFSGLKTAVMTLAEKERLNVLDPEVQADLAVAFQRSVVTHLEDKLKLAFAWCAENNIQPTSLVVSGGVASNQAVRTK